MTKIIIELPSWEVNKNDLAEIANKMQAIELSFNDLINDIPELKKWWNGGFSFDVRGIVCLVKKIYC